MKNFVLSALLLVVYIGANAQSDKYAAAMKKNLAAMDFGFNNPANLLVAANNFERIVTAEKNQWLPYYYAAFCTINSAFMQTDKEKMDGIADKANTLIIIADSLSPKNSEISCIKSMIASGHMMVNPQQRWQEYGQESSSQLDAAIQQDASNPRPYFLKGQALKYTPEQFGGGCKTARPQFQTALDKYESFKPASDISPVWGKEYVVKLMADCK